MVDRAVASLLSEAETRARDLVRHNRKTFERLVETLEQHESLYREQIEEILSDAKADASGLAASGLN